MLSEGMAELKEERAAKRARTATFASNQLAGPPRLLVEDVDDQDDEPIYQPGRLDRRAVDRQPGDQTQVTSNAAGKKSDAGPSRVVTYQPQGFQDEQPGKISLSLWKLGRAGCSHNYRRVGSSCKRVRHARKRFQRD